MARGSPFIEVLVFKHNENKVRLLYTINTCPELENPLKLESNSKQTYLMLPCNCTFSLDGEFMQTTNHEGRVRIFKMPPILDPLTIEKQLPKEDSQASKASLQQPAFVNTQVDESNMIINIRGDLESVDCKTL